jgi:hypothetical protein
MFSTKTRNTIAALVASVSFAGVAVVPTVAQAEPNGGGSDVERCNELEGQYAKERLYLDEAHEAKDQKEINFWREQASDTYNEAYGMGCDWTAERARPPSEGRPTSGLTPTPVGTLQPQGGTTISPLHAVTTTATRLR